MDAIEVNRMIAAGVVVFIAIFAGMALLGLGVFIYWKRRKR